VQRYEEGLLSLMRSQHRDILDGIFQTKQLTDELGEKLKNAVESYTKTFVAQEQAQAA
jgi:F-type H+-transporting ATPase subunit alpha